MITKVCEYTFIFFECLEKNRVHVVSPENWKIFVALD